MSRTSPKGPAGRGELLFYKVARLVTVGFSRLYLPGRVSGKENMLEAGACIVAPVHRSYVDWLIVARVTRRRRLRYIAKSELWHSKFFGRLIEALGAFPVNRSGADREALERCREVLAGGEPLVMFPEGTRRSGPAVTDLREGVAYLALRAGVPVVPVGIGGSEQAMPRGSVLPRPRRVEVVIGTPLWPSSVAEAAKTAPAVPRVAEDGDPAPDDVAAGGGGAASAETSHSRTGRVSRRATKGFSEELGGRIQEVFDEARRRAGVSG